MGRSFCFPLLVFSRRNRLRSVRRRTRRENTFKIKPRHIFDIVVRCWLIFQDTLSDLNIFYFAASRESLGAQNIEEEEG
jgi:hypothetical protein